MARFSSHIQHIVAVMLESHDFDNYYGTYSQVTGAYCPQTVHGEIPNGTCVPLYPKVGKVPYVRPFEFTPKNWTIKSPMLHGYHSTIGSWDHGAMDGFFLAEHAGLDPFGYYDNRTIPTVWDLAEEYGLGDKFYSTALTYSLPSHWDLIAGQSPSSVMSLGLEGVRAGHNPNRTLYLHQAANTTLVGDLLANRTNVSWRYYDYALGS